MDSLKGKLENETTRESEIKEIKIDRFWKKHIAIDKLANENKEWAIKSKQNDKYIKCLNCERHQ